jgi:hypothetical protein
MEQELKENGIGKGVYLEENTAWTLPDVDYTPYQNILSAVWPSLRHKSYKAFKFWKSNMS